MKKNATTKTVCIILLLGMLTSSLAAQETKTIFGGKYDVSFLWGFDYKINSIQGNSGTLIGVYAGGLFDRSTAVAFTVGSNIGHPTINYSYIGLWTQYTVEPYEVLHYSGQLLLALGSVKEYMRSKSSMMDDFGNTSGPGFFIVEPGVLAEVNLSEKVRMGAGVNYRVCTGLDNNNALIAKTKVTSADLSGFNAVLNVKIGLYE